MPLGRWDGDVPALIVGSTADHRAEDAADEQSHDRHRDLEASTSEG
jgi:hypothetical protein